MTNKLTALVVDDEKDARDFLKYLLKSLNEIEVIDEAEDLESAILKFLGHKPDVVFLDLVMPGKGGIEFIELLKKQKIETNIVIVSAYRNLAIEAIRNEVYDFLLKPFGSKDLKNIVSKILNRRAKNNSLKIDNFLSSFVQNTKLKLSSANSHVLIDPNEILYCAAEGSYTYVHLDNGKIEISNTYLGKIEEILRQYNFYRIGRSTLINLDKLWRANKSDSSCILLSNKKEVKLYGSKKQIKELCKMDLNNQG